MKLIKTVTDNYILVDATKEFHGEGYLLGTTTVSDAPRLSLKNCQAIERGYDLDEIIFKFIGRTEDDYNEINEIQKDAIEYGFQKAIEILGDKKFSEQDVLNAMDRVWDWCEDDKDEDCSSMTELRNKHIKSLQQTEWDVSFNPDVKDSEGCLILKRL